VDTSFNDWHMPNVIAEYLMFYYECGVCFLPICQCYTLFTYYLRLHWVSWCEFVFHASDSVVTRSVWQLK